MFDVIIFFKLRTKQQKTVKPTYLCPLGATKLAEEKGRETAQSRALFLPPASWHLTDKNKLV